MKLVAVKCFWLVQNIQTFNVQNIDWLMRKLISAACIQDLLWPQVRNGDRPALPCDSWLISYLRHTDRSTAPTSPNLRPTTRLKDPEKLVVKTPSLLLWLCFMVDQFLTMIRCEHHKGKAAGLSGRKVLTLQQLRTPEQDDWLCEWSQRHKGKCSYVRTTLSAGLTCLGTAKAVCTTPGCNESRVIII